MLSNDHTHLPPPMRQQLIDGRHHIICCQGGTSFFSLHGWLSHAKSQEQFSSMAADMCHKCGKGLELSATVLQSFIQIIERWQGMSQRFSVRPDHIHHNPLEHFAVVSEFANSHLLCTERDGRCT